MELCTIDTGILFWKKPCGGVIAGVCANCERTICNRHMIVSTPLGVQGPLCPDCDMASREDRRPIQHAGASAAGAALGAFLATRSAASADSSGNDSDSGSDYSGDGDGRDDD